MAMQESLINILANKMLKSDMPEFKKANVRLLLAARSVIGKVNEIMDDYASPELEKTVSDETLYPARIEMCNFLQSVELEIDEFVKRHPSPAKTQD